MVRPVRTAGRMHAAVPEKSSVLMGKLDSVRLTTALSEALLKLCSTPMLQRPVRTAVTVRSCCRSQPPPYSSNESAR